MTVPPYGDLPPVARGIYPAYDKMLDRAEAAEAALAQIRAGKFGTSRDAQQIALDYFAQKGER